MLLLIINPPWAELLLLPVTLEEQQIFMVEMELPDNGGQRMLDMVAVVVEVLVHILAVIPLMDHKEV